MAWGPGSLVAFADMADIDFSQLDAYQVRADKTRVYTLPISTKKGAPFVELDVVSAHEPANPGYRDERSRGVRKGIRKASQLTGPDGARWLKALLDEDRKLYPKHVIKGWRHVYNAGGTEIPFSAGACEALLGRVPDDMFEGLRDFCGDPDNHREISLEEVAKN